MGMRTGTSMRARSLLPIRRSLVDAVMTSAPPADEAAKRVHGQHRSKLTDKDMSPRERRSILASYVKWLEYEKRAGLGSIVLWLGLDRGFVQRVLDLQAYRDEPRCEPPASAYKVAPPWL